MKTLPTLILVAMFLATGCAAIIGEPRVRGELEFTTGSNIPVRLDPNVSSVKIYSRDAIETNALSAMPSNEPGAKGSR
jgi:hypothetical protein